MNQTWKAPPATHAIWQDPSSYDPALHGPPYLPSSKASKTAAAVPSEFVMVAGYRSVEDALPAILVFLRALAMIHQTNHWVTSGPNYYGDHLLFERLYDGILKEVDAVAERAVGADQGGKVANLRGQVLAIQRIVAIVYGEEEEGDAAEVSLRAEEVFLSSLRYISKEMEASGTLTKGTDDLLSEIESKHEEHLYLLKQRLAYVWKSV